MKGYKLVVTFLFLLIILVRCAGESFFDQSGKNYSGYIIVTTVQNAQTTAAAPSGSGFISLFDPTGKFVGLLKDYYSTAEYVNGLVYGGHGDIIFNLMGGSMRLERVDLFSRAVSAFSTNSNITSAPLRQMARDRYDGIYVVRGSSNIIEKVDANGTRVGAPFINTTVTTGANTCTLNAPFGVTYITSQDRIAVSQFRLNAGTMLIYDLSGNCISSVATSPFDVNYNTSIVYHPQTNTLLVSRFSDSKIYATTVSGAMIGQAFLNTSVVSGPTAMAVDSQGYVYIGSANLDTIEKMSFDGTTLTSVSGLPFINVSAYTLNPTSIVVVP